MNSGEIEFFQLQGIQYIETIGRGCFGIIFHVYSSQYNTTFALKRIPMNAFNEAEVECLNRVDSPRMVRLYKVFKFNDNIYLLMEFCKTDFLKLGKHKIINSKLFVYIHEIFQAVKVCHIMNIAHNDIKPSNFLLDQYGHVKICDFGLSKIYTENPSSLDKKGSKYYMAPEMFGDKEYNPIESDIWALGVTIYFITTSKHPFEADNEHDLIERIKSGVYADDIIINPDLKSLIASCLRLDPKQRPNIEDLLNAPYFKNGKADGLHKANTLGRCRRISQTHGIIKPIIDTHKLNFAKMQTRPLQDRSAPIF